MLPPPESIDIMKITRQRIPKEQCIVNKHIGILSECMFLIIYDQNVEEVPSTYIYCQPNSMHS